MLWLVTAVRYGPGAVFQFSARAVALFALAGTMGTAIGRLVVYSGIDRLGAAINTAGVSTRPLFAVLIGAVVLTGGLAVLSLSKGGDVEGWRRRDLLFPLSAAALYAGANAVRRTGLEAGSAGALPAVTVNETAAVLVVLGYVLVRGRTDELLAPRETHLLFALVGVLTATGMVSLFTALEHPAGRLVVVDPLVAAAPLFTTVFASVLLGDVERVTRGVVCGALVVVAGAAFVTLG